ncbi:MAG: lysophospholipid acyltransferase family protein [Desulfonatronovibrionaceae bacterium]
MRDVIYNLLVLCLRMLPLRALHCAGEGLGRSIWFFAPSRRRYALRAVRHRLNTSPREARRIAGQSFLHSGKSFMELPYFGFDFRFLEQNLEVSDPEMLARIAASPRPLVLPSAHFGAWELLSPTMVMLLPGKNGLGAVRLPKDNSLARVMQHLRTRSKLSFLPHRGSAVRILQHLKKGGAAGFLVDHNCQRHEASFISFLGKKAAVNTGPALLAVRSKAVLWPVFLLRRPRGRYRLLCMEPLDTREVEGDLRERVGKCAGFYTGAVERVVREYPEQWFWMHRRWKTRPRGE